MFLFDLIWEAAKAVWNYIVKIVVAVCDYVKNICRYFREAARQGRLRDPGVIAVAVRKHLDDGNFNVITCLFDEEEQKVIDPEDMEIITAERLDDETNNKFGKNDVLVLS